MAAFSCRAFTFASWSRRSSIAAANTAASSSGLLPFFLRPAGGDAPSVGDGELRSGDGPREGEPEPPPSETVASSSAAAASAAAAAAAS